MSKKKTGKTSAALTMATLAKKLDREFPSVAVIVGKEDLLIREARDLIFDKLPGGAPDKDQIHEIGAQVRPDEEKLRDIFDELRTPSLFGGTPIVVIDDADRWFKLDPEAWGKILAESFGNSLLILRAKSLDGRSKIAKLLKTTGWWISSDRPFHRPPPWKPDASPWDHDMNHWVVHRFRQKGLQIAPETAQILIDRLGPVMAPLASTVEKISLLSDANKTQIVDEKIVLEQTPSGGDGSAFDLVDRWFENDRSGALELLANMLETGWLDEKDQRVKNPQGLMLQCSAMALKRARELRAVHAIVEKGGKEAEILAETGIARPFLPRIRKQFRHCNKARIEKIISSLIEMDWQMKSGAGPTPQELLERAILTA
ncbi:MAG: hypothetical protein H8E43_04365 [Planctomycetia bacterium]|nr:hypothetical protein [Planctomycetia bacterium]MBL6914757.1 hypothetical protein [Planctomycetota bacterium]HCW43910.1 hypothetical protein [Planctomycetota bacterium]